MNEIEEREKADRKKKGGKDKKRKGEEETEQAKKKTKAWSFEQNKTFVERFLFG